MTHRHRKNIYENIKENKKQLIERQNSVACYHFWLKAINCHFILDKVRTR